MYLGSFEIDDYVGIPAATHRFSSGAAYAPTTLTYSIYEDAGTTGIDENVDMVVASPFDGIVGCYWIRRQLTAAAGFEAGKNYVVVVKATVDSVSAISIHTFQIGAKVRTVDLGTQAKADVNAEVDSALNTAIPGSPTADSVNERIKAIDDKLPAGNIGDATAANQTTIASYIDTEIAAIKAKTDNLPASPAATGDIPTTNAIADQVWDEAISGHLGAGSTGAALNAAGSAGDPWNTAIPGAYGAGTAGKILGDNINATISSRSSHSAADIWSVGTRTLTSFGTLVTDIWAAATRTLTSFGTLPADVWSSGTRTLTSFGTLVSDIATAVWAAGTRTLTSFGTLITDIWASATRTLSAFAFTPSLDASYDAAKIAASAADVLTQVNGALDAAGSELGSVPTTTGTLRQKLNYIFQYFRNKRSADSTTETMYKEDATTTLGTATLSDVGGVVTKGEMN